MNWTWLPSWPTFVCTFLTWAIPLTIYRINRKLHEIGDPAWKKVNSSNENKES